MQRTIYICDTCEKEVDKELQYTVGIAVHKGKDKAVSSYLDVCEDCLKETGFEHRLGDSYNHSQIMKTGYKKWAKWFMKGRKV